MVRSLVDAARNASAPRLGSRPFTDETDAQFGIVPGHVEEMIDPGSGPKKNPGLAKGPAQGTAAELRARALKKLKAKAAADAGESPTHSSPSPANSDAGVKPEARNMLVQKALQYGSGAKGSERGEASNATKTLNYAVGDCPGGVGEFGMTPPRSPPASAQQEPRTIPTTYRIDSPAGSHIEEPVFSLHDRLAAVEKVLTHQSEFHRIVE